MQLIRLVPCLFTIVAAAADPAPAPVAQPALAPVVAAPADAAAFVRGWIAAVHGNDLAPVAAQLMQPAPELADGRRPPGGVAGMARMLGDGQHAGVVLAAMLAELAGSLAVDGKAPAAVALPEEPRFLAFLPRMAGRGLPGMVAGGILAKGLETRQTEALEAWAVAYLAWAAQAPLADPATATKAQASLASLAELLKTEGAFQHLQAILPALKQALLVYGLDADTALAGAVVEAEGAAAADGSQTVVVRFKAFAADHVLPLRVRRDGGGWALVADSPLARWLRVGGGGMMGGRGMPGQRGNQRGGQNGRGGEAPAPAPAGPPASGSF